MKSCILLIIAIAVSGCALTLPMVPADLEEICIWVHKNIPYVAEAGDNWQLPAVTMKNGGDCEDMAILFMALANEYLDIRPDMIVIEVAPGLYHAVAIYDGYIYDPVGPAIYADWYYLEHFGRLIGYYTYPLVMYFAIITGADT